MFDTINVLLMHWLSELKDNEKNITTKLLLQSMNNVAATYVNYTKLNAKLQYRAYVSARNIQVR